MWSQSVDPVTSAPIGKASSIGPNAAAIYAVIPVKNVGSGWVVSASWTFNGDALNDVGSSLTAANAIGEGWIEFHLTLAADQTWPVGTLAVAVRQAGGNSVHASLKISRPTG